MRYFDSLQAVVDSEPPVFDQAVDKDYQVVEDEKPGLPERFHPGFIVLTERGEKIGYIHRDTRCTCPQPHKFVALGMWEWQPIDEGLSFNQAMMAVVVSYAEHLVKLS
jgi:hypothetical protein